MPDRSRFYITTAIAYANNKPGIHTLHEVVAADAMARWHRMSGRPTRFLTGTDEYSVNIAQAAAAQGRDPKVFVDEMVALFRQAEDALGISPDRFIRTTDPDHQRSVHEIIRRCYANGDLYQGQYEGWYCPNEGFIPKSQLVEDAHGTHCANHPTVELQWLSETNWFFRLSKYQAALERHYAEHPDWVEPEYRKNEMLGFMAQGLEDFSASRAGATWGIPFPILPDGSSAQREDGSWDPAAGTVYVWFDALINYITGAGFPDDLGSFADSSRSDEPFDGGFEAVDWDSVFSYSSQQLQDLLTWRETWREDFHNRYVQQLVYVESTSLSVVPDPGSGACDLAGLAEGTPVVEMVPLGTASPNACAAWSTSPHLHPPSTRTVRSLGSTRTLRIRERSITRPSLSVDAIPAMLICGVSTVAVPARPGSVACHGRTSPFRCTRGERASGHRPHL